MGQQGIQEFRLPDVGEGLVDAEILQWYVQPGDEVTVNQMICEIETAKAAVELPSPYAGTVTELLVEAGATVDVGTVIIRVDTGGGAAPDRAPAGEGAAEEEEEREKPLVGYGEKAGATQRRRRRSPQPAGASAAPAAPAASAGTAAPAAPQVQPPVAPQPPQPAAAAQPASSAPLNGGPTRVLAKPPVRKLAKDLGVDLRTITPTGPGGTVTREDVRRHSEAAVPAVPAPAPEAVPAAAEAPAAVAAPAAGVAAGEREQRIPIKGVRKRTAAAMVNSAFTAPHVTEFLQVDVTKTMKAVRKLRERREFADVKVSPLLLVARALLTAVRRHPEVNASWDEQAQEIVVKNYVNLGIAAATERGLVVPNVKDAHAKPLPELARELQNLTDTARQGRTTPADMTGGTITITNVGVFGVDAGTPILNPGEAAILAFGQIRDMPWVHKGKLKVRKVTTLSLSFDHRLVDGELGSKVLRDVGAVLEDPETVALAWG
ncbi:pyruvate dehydrogenase E2 component (dihydrolipoamide acetyltransferase) [Nocardiopsis mwathae]|uniref:Dihydrolipoamide acetyltransferase component of pyruvate dehydrogenase complex n=1 Tax=Nocardiopsis mwathae TaxID=1472723 RepID=A0A7W9YKW7_9ACTN|nr:dihydrolipoamide acetyltransferase family protein [Nocardiopsis mwathae]MBB6174054.1 pyruvate dehydrogenase E2 component (dihydrolipoamide acetyltransferase) [Nocardiopsis mwathae]